MKIKQLQLENYGRFDDLTIEFAPTKEKRGNVTLIVGNNGAGKSQILQALTTGLNFFLSNFKQPRSMRSSNGGFVPPITEDISDLLIKNNKDSVSCKIAAYLPETESSEKYEFEYTITHSVSVKDGVCVDVFDVNFGEIIENTRIYLGFTEDANFPILAFYPVNRFDSKEIVFSEVESENYNRYSAYQNALDANINFESFLDWFKYREDIENAETRKSIDKVLLQMKSSNDSNTEVIASQLSKIANKKDIQLTACKKAIMEFLSFFSDIWIDREVKPFTMRLSKGEDELIINQLSQGEKSMLALVGDIARRLAILNPSRDNPLEGEGIIMIDEADLHLHPKWQHDLIDKLVDTFPNCQFILTTHSPHLISDRDDMLVYALNDGELSQVPNVYGEDVNTLLTQVFNVDVRDSKVEKQFIHIRRTISDKNFNEAENAIATLAEQLPTQNVELLKCRLMLAQAQLEEKGEA